MSCFYKNLIFRLVLVFVLVPGVPAAHAQALFKQSYNVPGDAFMKGMHTNTLDGGMVLITRSNNSNGSQYFTVFKTLANGDVQWTQRFLQPGNCITSNIVQLPDSSYFFCFVELNYPEKYYITHLGKTGVLLYCKSLSPPGDFILAFDPQCIAKPDGNVYIASDLFNQVTGMFGWHLFEVDTAGNIVFSNCYNGGSLKCLGRSFTLCANSDLLMAGYQRDSIVMHYGPVITRIDAAGTLLWSKLYLDTTADIAGISVCETANGNITVTAINTTPGNEMVRLETDAAGNLLRARDYGRASTAIAPHVSLEAENNCLLVFGTTDTGSFCMKLDPTGNVLHAQRYSWVAPGRISRYGSNQYSFSGVDTQSNNAIIFTADSTLGSCFGTAITIDTGSVHFRVSTIAYSYPVVLYDTVFALRDTLWPGTNTKNCGPVGIAAHTTAPAVQLFPNPASGVVNIRCDKPISTLELYDAAGGLLRYEKVNSTDYMLQILPPLPGLYLVRIQTENSTQSIRFIVE